MAEAPPVDDLLSGILGLVWQTIVVLFWIFAGLIAALLVMGIFMGLCEKAAAVYNEYQHPNAATVTKITENCATVYPEHTAFTVKTKRNRNEMDPTLDLGGWSAGVFGTKDDQEVQLLLSKGCTESEALERLRREVERAAELKVFTEGQREADYEWKAVSGTV